MVEKRQILRAQRACQANGVIEPAVADSMGGEANHAVSKTLWLPFRLVGRELYV